eukprot:1024348-Pelagomonas_calceolata.AAC.4
MKTHRKPEFSIPLSRMCVEPLEALKPLQGLGLGTHKAALVLALEEAPLANDFHQDQARSAPPAPHWPRCVPSSFLGGGDTQCFKAKQIWTLKLRSSNVGGATISMLAGLLGHEGEIQESRQEESPRREKSVGKTVFVF